MTQKHPPRVSWTPVLYIGAAWAAASLGTWMGMTQGLRLPWGNAGLKDIASCLAHGSIVGLIVGTCATFFYRKTHLPGLLVAGLLAAGLAMAMSFISTSMSAAI